MRVFWMEILDLKSSAMRITRYNSGQKLWRLSNEILFIHVAQETTKLPEVKVWGLNKIGVDPCFLMLIMWSAMIFIFFRTSNFDLSKSCSTLSYIDVRYLIWKSLQFLNLVRRLAVLLSSNISNPSAYIYVVVI